MPPVPAVDRRAVTAHMDRKERGKAAPDGAAFLFYPVMVIRLKSL